MTPAEIKTAYAEALRLDRNGNAAGALALLGRIVEAKADIPEAQFQIGRIFTENFRTERAIFHLTAAAKAKPSEPAIWRAWADAAALAADDATEKAFLKALRASPLQVPTRILLEDRFGKSRAKTQPSTGGLQRTDVAALVGLYEKGQFAEAASCATTLLRKAPRSALVANVLGSALERLGRKDEALKVFRALTSMEPAYAEAHLHLGKLLLGIGEVQQAVAPLRQAVALTPSNVPALVTLGEALTRRGSVETAMRYIERALCFAPHDVAALLAAAHAEMRRSNPAAAEAALLTAETMTKDLPDTYRVMLAQAQSQLGKDDAAMANYDRVIARSPMMAAALTGKAVLLQVSGSFDEAEPIFRRAFACDGVTGDAFRLFIASHKTKPGDPILDQMRARYDNPETSDEDRANLGFAIAKALEDVKQYDLVFRYLDAANAMVRKAHPWTITQRHTEIDQIMQAHDRFDFFSAQTAETNDFAPIFVTGMPRSGTTLVEQIISSHSAVTGAGEIGIAHQLADATLRGGLKTGYSHVSDLGNDEIMRLGQDYAAKLRARYPLASRITDKSIQTYMFMGIIRLALPNAKFVVVHRDPRDTLLSIYKNKFPDGTHLYAYDQKDLALYWRTFEAMISFWKERLPDVFFEIQYEDLVADPEPQTRRLIKACGLMWEDACLSFHQNDRKVETLSLYQVRQPIYRGSAGGWHRYASNLAPMLQELDATAARTR